MEEEEVEEEEVVEVAKGSAAGHGRGVTLSLTQNW